MFFIMLLALFICFNGRFSLEIFLFGLFLALLIDAFRHKFLNKGRLLSPKRVYLTVKYFMLLIWEIFIANTQVLRFILSNKYEVEPKLCFMKTELESDKARAILADSITLTPGTITASLEENSLIVHCLDKSLEDGLKNNPFEKRLSEIEFTDGKKHADENIKTDNSRQHDENIKTDNSRQHDENIKTGNSRQHDENIKKIKAGEGIIKNAR